MMYCPDCHCVVLEEDEFRDVVFYLDTLAETFESKVMEDDDILDRFHDILREWAGGDKN